MWLGPCQAEELACDWLRYMGHSGAQVTNQGADGGLDVIAAGAVAQVKSVKAKVGRPVIQQTVGAARGRRCAVFARGGFTRQAIAWAETAAAALFQFDHDGHIEAVTSHARYRLAGAARRRS